LNIPSSARRAGCPVTFVGRIPAGWPPSVALERFAAAAGKVVAGLTAACDESPEDLFQGRPRVGKSERGLPTTVIVPFVIRGSVEDALLARLEDGCHLALPAPWSGRAACCSNP